VSLVEVHCPRIWKSLRTLEGMAISIKSKRMLAVKQAKKGERKTFSAPALSYVPPPAPQRRPTIPSIEPPVLALTPASPAPTWEPVPVKIKDKSGKFQKSAARSLSDYASCPAATQFLGGVEDDGFSLDGRKEKRPSQLSTASTLSTITEKHGSLGSSPTIFSLLTTDRLSAPAESSHGVRGERSNSESKGVVRPAGESFDLTEFEATLPVGADDLQFEMDETGLETHPEENEDEDYMGGHFEEQ